MLVTVTGAVLYGPALFTLHIWNPHYLEFPRRIFSMGLQQRMFTIHIALGANAHSHFSTLSEQVWRERNWGASLRVITMVMTMLYITLGASHATIHHLKTGSGWAPKYACNQKPLPTACQEICNRSWAGYSEWVLHRIFYNKACVWSWILDNSRYRQQYCCDRPSLGKILILTVMARWRWRLENPLLGRCTQAQSIFFLEQSFSTKQKLIIKTNSCAWN